MPQPPSTYVSPAVMKGEVGFYVVYLCVKGDFIQITNHILSFTINGSRSCRKFHQMKDAHTETFIHVNPDIRFGKMSCFCTFL